MCLKHQSFGKCPSVSPADLADLHGNGSPKGVVDSRRIGDEYIDDVSGLSYYNPNASGNTGWELVSSVPA